MKSCKPNVDGVNKDIASTYPSPHPHGLMFHYFHSRATDYGGQGSLTAEDFESLLNFVGLHRILTPEEWIARMQDSSLTNEDLCITFDDGLRCQYDVCMPVLDKYGLKAFWFIYSAPFCGSAVPLEIYRRFRNQCFDSVDDYYSLFFRAVESKEACNLYDSKFDGFSKAYERMFPFYSKSDIKYRYLRDQILGPARYRQLVDELIDKNGVDRRELAEGVWLDEWHLKKLVSAGHMLGLHSFDHPSDLAQLTVQEQFEQYIQNKKHLEQFNPVVAMSHPCNSYTAATLETLIQLGIKCGFRSNMQPPAGRSINDSPLELAREDSSNIFRQISNRKQQATKS